jgi:hypothetical protein
MKMASGERGDGSRWELDAGAQQSGLNGREQAGRSVDGYAAWTGEIEFAIEGRAGGVAVGRGDGLKRGVGAEGGVECAQSEGVIARSCDLMAKGYESCVDATELKADDGSDCQNEADRDPCENLAHLATCYRSGRVETLT